MFLWLRWPIHILAGIKYACASSVPCRHELCASSDLWYQAIIINNHGTFPVYIFKRKLAGLIIGSHYVFCLVVTYVPFYGIYIQISLQCVLKGSSVKIRNWMKRWFGPYSWQVVTRANVYYDVVYHIASVGHNELMEEKKKKTLHTFCLFNSQHMPYDTLAIITIKNDYVNTLIEEHCLPV